MSQIPLQKLQESRSRSCETACSSNSSCYFQRRRPAHPLATNHFRSHISRGSNGNPVRQRIQSAKLLKLRSLQNQLNDANYHLAELMRENQALKTLQRRQDKALTKYEGTNAELPRILQSYESEIRVLTEKNKQLKKTIKELTEQIKCKNDEINNLQVRLKHFENLDKNKHLLEREKLLETIDDYKTQLQKADDQIVLLNRKLILETKSNKQKLNLEISKHKQCQRELEKSYQDIAKLTKQLQEKEKMSYANNVRVRNQQQPQSTIATNDLKSPETETNSDTLKTGVKLEPIKNSKITLESPRENKLISRPNSSIKLEKIVRDSPKIDDNFEGNKIDRLTKKIEERPRCNDLDKQLTESYLSALDSLKACSSAIEIQKEQLEFTQSETAKILESVRRVDAMEKKLKNSQVLSFDSENFNQNDVDLITKMFANQLNFPSKYSKNKNTNGHKEPNVGVEEKRKLLATLRAIDNGENSFDSIDTNPEFPGKLLDVTDNDN